MEEDIKSKKSSKNSFKDIISNPCYNMLNSGCCNYFTKGYCK